ncbi:MAG: AAA family ATPase [Actinobacteria bacterium]|nr:AAA family ATPase [Actinomycetota bacterium]
MRPMMGGRNGQRARSSSIDGCRSTVAPVAYGGLVTEAAIFDGLNDEQREAVEAVRGPVCILAGAGSGKTTTITRRIANQVVTGAFAPSEILAVTFTDRAAGEMRSRLEKLGVEGVRASTFHSAALAQLRRLSQEEPAQILPSKAQALRQIGNTLPKPYRFRPAGDLATEIEWAKNRRIGTDIYPDGLRGHDPPIPADLMVRVYERYERGKRERNLIDFEDLLELTIQMFRNDLVARDRFIAKYKAFTVDEYQDVNLLQETVLQEWVAGRDDLCVVGDDYQSIYGFTGASPTYLLEMPLRFANTRIVRLETNYRSTSQVLDVANRLVPNLGGAEKRLHSARDEGPAVSLRPFSTASGETRALIERIRDLHSDGVAYEDMAILYRVNFRSEDYEELLSAEGIPYQVTDGAFLTRQAARQILARLRRSTATDVDDEVRRLADEAGYLVEIPDGLGDQEVTRQNDLARLVRLAQEFDDGTHTGTDFAQDLERRFGGDGGGRGVVLITFHRAKGLEWEAVFLPRLEEGEIPFKRSKTPAAIAEERRLFYVGITRAKTHLMLTWANDGRRKASRFVGELRVSKDRSVPMHAEVAAEEIEARIGLEVELRGGFSGAIDEIDGGGVYVEIKGGPLMRVAFGETVTAEGKTLALGPPSAADAEVLAALKEWRLERAKKDAVPAFVIFHDTTLQAIAETAPKTPEELAELPGIGPTKLERYGSEILALTNRS